MSEALFPFYERELIFIRQLAQDFAKHYPAAAGRLLLEQHGSADPHVERLLESFALISGRIHQKLDDDFPELTDALLSILYPHYLAPIPSMATIQFELDPARAQLPDGFTIARHSRLRTPPINNVSCKYCTAYPVTLWPVKLTAAQLQPPPFPAGLQIPPQTAAVLRLQFETQGGVKLADLSLERLRFHLNGDPFLVPVLYELLFNNVIQVVFRPVEPETEPKPVHFRPEQCLFQVGFEAEEGLLPYPKRSLMGYRLLTELFTYPSKFLFVDLGGWKNVCRAGFQKNVEAIFFLNRSVRNLEQALNPSMFQQGCTPIVNLFEQTAEPVNLSAEKYEYRVVPDGANPEGMEVYSVNSVTSTESPTEESAKLLPFYSFNHDRDPEKAISYWFTTRRPSIGQEDNGSEVFLSLVDRKFRPRYFSGGQMELQTTCSNRDLPTELQKNEGPRFELESAAPLKGIHLVRPPTSPLRPPPRRGGSWKLVSHFQLNHLSLSDPSEGLQAFKDILRLYDFSDPDAGQQQMAAVNRQLIEGIQSLVMRRVVGRNKDTGFCRGIEVTLEFDQEKYIGNIGIHLFASVLERFLGLYISENSFCQLIGKTQQPDGYHKKWPPRSGEVPLV